LNSLRRVQSVLTGRAVFPPPIGCLFPSSEDFQIGLHKACYAHKWEWIGVQIKRSAYLPFERPPSPEEKEGLERVFKIGIVEGPFQKRLSQVGIKAFFLSSEINGIFLKEYQETLSLIEDASTDVEAFLLAEDVVSVSGPMISLDLFRKLLQPGMEFIGKLCQKLEKPFGFHADGDYRLFLPVLKEIGVTFLHGLCPLDFQDPELKNFALIVPRGTIKANPLLWEDL
jgi:hypothetical protein